MAPFFIKFLFPAIANIFFIPIFLENQLLNMEKVLNGMGAIVGPDGVTFRVWAPNANKVCLMGSFNEWDDTSLLLNQEGDGYWAIHVENAQEGDEYKYVISNGERIFYRNDPYAKKMNHSNGNGIIIDLYKDWEDHEFHTCSFNELVIYEMHVGTFNRNGVENGQVGNLYTAVEKLDYLKDLGINAIELMPIMEFPGDNSWGYNPSQPFAVETSYGGPEGLKHFIFEAHIRGIAVIMDVVYNHFGPSETDLWQFDGWEENGLGGIYFYNDYRAKTPWGENRPDYGRKEVRVFLRDNAMMWLEAYQCDGLRFDATAIIRLINGYENSENVLLEDGFNFLRDLNTELREKFPQKILIAEDLKADPVVTARLNSNGLGFHSQWGVGFVHSLRNVLTERSDEQRNLQSVVDSVFETFNNDVFQRIIFTESHDQVANGASRLPEEIQAGEADGEFAKKKSTLGAITLFTAPGIPMIFQGQEFLSFGKFDDVTPLDWEMTKNFNGINKMYRDLIRLRKAENGRSKGLTGSGTKILHYNEDNLVLVYARVHSAIPDQPVISILNFSHELIRGYRIGMEGSGDWQVIFNSGWKGYDEDFSEVDLVVVKEQEGFDSKPFSILVDIPSYGGIILAR